MAGGTFHSLLAARWAEGRHICVGLDLDARALGLTDDLAGLRLLVDYGQMVVTETRELAAAYKPNSAFFEHYGADGIAALRSLVAFAHAEAPGVPVIVDAKRADIASTNDGYVSMLYDYLDADATTLHPYLGREALRPFLERADKGAFILCRTSNPGAGEIQDLDVLGEPLFIRLAKMIAEDWNGEMNCGLVVGATYPDELARVRDVSRDMPLLIPGVGAQGGDLEVVIRQASRHGDLSAIINISRGILYGEMEAGETSAQAVRRRALHFHTKLGTALDAIESA